MHPVFFFHEKTQGFRLEHTSSTATQGNGVAGMIFGRSLDDLWMMSRRLPSSTKSEILHLCSMIRTRRVERVKGNTSKINGSPTLKLRTG